MVWGRITPQHTSSALGSSDGVLLTKRLSRRGWCVRPLAVASSDLKADDTAEARRRLARQFRRHKLEPQPASQAELSIQGLHPRPRQQLEDPQLQTLAGQTGQSLTDSGTTNWSTQPAVDAPAVAATAAAVARQLLERQFMLGSSPAFPASSSSNATSSQLAESLLHETTVSTAASKQITKAIVSAKHWRQVQSLVQEHEPHLLPIHLCACLTRMVHLQDSFGTAAATAPAAVQPPSPQQQQQQPVHPQAAAFLQQLLDSIAAVQPLLCHRQACNVLWAASKLQDIVSPSTGWVASMYQHALNSNNGTTGMHVTQLAYALVGLKECLPQQQVQQVACAVLDSSQTLMQDQLYKQQAGQSSDQQQAVLAQQHRQVDQPLMTARDLATLTWSFASLGVQPSTAWLSAYASVISSSSSGVLSAAATQSAHGNEQPHRDLSNLLWATAVFSKSAAEGSAAANSLHAAATALRHACELQDGASLRSWDSQSVSNTLWALATLGQRPSVTWLNKLLQHVENSAVSDMSAQGVSVTLWALAALGVVPQPTCMSALLKAAHQHMHVFTPQAASNMIWALAVLERAPDKLWLMSFWPRCRAMLPHMTSQGLVNCLWAIARLGVQPPQEWVVDAAGLLLAQGVQNLSSQGLSNVLWAVARINNRGRQGQELLDAALQQAVVLLEQQLQQQQQQQQEEEEEEQEDEASSLAEPSASAALNIYELSGMMHTVSLLMGQQQSAAASSSGAVSPAQTSSSAVQASQPRLSRRSRSDSSSVSSRSSSHSSVDDHTAVGANQPGDVLSHLARLLQSTSLPLLPSAGAAELSILLWSQVTMPAPSNQTASQTAGQASGQTSSLLIPRAWMEGWLEASKGCFGAASSRDLAQWLWCLAKRGVRPTGQWMASFQVASFRQMSTASSQDLSNMLWAFASMGIAPDPAWLQQHLREVARRQAQRQLLPQHLANLGWALAKLGHRPDKDWATRYQEDVYQALLQDDLKPQEMSNVLWALAVLNCKAETALLDECQSFMAAHLDSFKANEVAVSLWAMARLKCQPAMRLMGAALQHCFTQARQLTPTGLSMLVFSVGNLETPPPKAWVVKLLVATQVRMSGFSAQELAMLAVSLARLEYRPPDVWLDCFTAAAEVQMSRFEAQTLANTLWALATLHYTPTEEWMCAFDRQLQQHINTCTPAHIAMIVWAMSRLQWLPEELLWRQLQERAELHSASFTLRSQRMLDRAIRVLEKVEAEEE